MIMYRIRWHNTIKFDRDTSTSAYADDSISYKQEETFGVITKGEFRKENIRGTTVRSFLDFLNQHKEALRSLS
jgi:hypothetical protein